MITNIIVPLVFILAVLFVVLITLKGIYNTVLFLLITPLFSSKKEPVSFKVKNIENEDIAENYFDFYLEGYYAPNKFEK